MKDIMSSGQGPQGEALPDASARATTGPRWLRRVRFSVAAAIPLAITVALVGWFGTNPTRHVSLPPASASPEQVVKAYLDAASAHDVTTMNALILGDHMFPASRFEPTWLVSRVKTNAPTRDDALVSTWASWRQVVYVDFTMHVIKGHDLNFPDNTDTYWGYVLARQSERDPWRIIEQGVG